MSLYTNEIGLAIELFGEWLIEYGPGMPAPELMAIAMKLGPLVKLGGLLYGELPDEVSFGEEWSITAGINCPRSVCGDDILILDVELYVNTEFIISFGPSSSSRVMISTQVEDWSIQDNQFREVWSVASDPHVFSEDQDYGKGKILFHQPIQKPFLSGINPDQLARAAGLAYNPFDAKIEDLVLIARSRADSGCYATTSCSSEEQITLMIDGWDRTYNEVFDCITIPYPRARSIAFLGSTDSGSGKLRFELESGDSTLRVIPNAPEIEKGRIKQVFNIQATSASPIIDSLTLRLIDDSSGQQISKKISFCVSPYSPPIAQDTVVTVTRSELLSNRYIAVKLKAMDPDLPSNNDCEIYFQLQDHPHIGQLVDSVGQQPTRMIADVVSDSEATGYLKWYPGTDIPVGEYVFSYQAGEMDQVFPFGEVYGQECASWSTAECRVIVLNTAPIANDDIFYNYSARLDGCSISVNGNVTSNDFDLDGQALSVHIVERPHIGSLNLLADGSFEFLFDIDELDLDSFDITTAYFSYYVSDGTANSEPATVALKLCPDLGTAPVLSVSLITDGRCSCIGAHPPCPKCYQLHIAVYDKDFEHSWRNEVVTISVDFGSGDTGFLQLDGFANSVGEATAKAVPGGSYHGTLVVWPGNWIKESEIEIKACDSTGQCASQVVRFPGEHPPLLDPAEISQRFDAWIPQGHGAGPLFIMDPDWEQAFCFTATDPDGDELDFFVNRVPRYGRPGVLASGFAGNYEVHATYMPSYDALVAARNANRPLQDSFTIIARDPYGGQDEARVSIQIDILNREPEAVNDAASTDQNVAVSIAVLDNDSDGDGDTLSIASVSQPQNGSASISGSHIVYTPDTGYVGDDVLSYTITDGYGGSATATVDVEVILVDFTPPTITYCPPDVDVSAGSGRCDATVNVGMATATDDLSTPSVEGERNDSLALTAVYPVGTTTILWTARDDSGNTNTCTQTVTVRDDQKPGISDCPGDQTVSCATGECSAIITWTEPIVDDNCSIASFTSTHLPGDSFPKGGPTTVTYTAIDVHGNTETCSFTVTVLDDEKPVIAGCPGNITTDLQPGACTALVSWTEPSATDNCDGVLTYSNRSHAPGASFGTGTTTVMYEYTDSSGNIDTCSFDVTVNDAVALVISCPGDMTVGTDADACGATVVYSVTADDPCGASIDQLEGLPSGSLFPIGTTVNRFRAIDAAGNTDVCEFSIEVSDDDDPAISGCPGNITVSSGVSQCSAVVNWTEPTATDNCGLASFSGDHAPGETFPLGATTVTYTAIDIYGNRSDCSFTITVEDNRDPDISGCPSDITVDALFGGCSRSVSWSEPTATDNCDGALSYTSRSHAPGSSIDVGTTEVTYTFRDDAGNSSQCQFDVTVRDTTNPNISCPSDITVDAETAWGANVYFNTPSASDNCDNHVEVSCSPSSGSFFWNGDTTVTCTAEDDSGNEDTCTFEVTVEENHDPVARNDSVSMSTGQGVIYIDALRNDYDIDNDDLEIISASTSCGYANVSGDLVEYGTMNCSAPAGSTITVNYTISDGRGGTDSAIISVTLPDAGPMSNP